MSEGPCNDFQILASRVLGLNAVKTFNCEMPVQQVDNSMPRELPVHMRGLGVTWPTENLAACENKAADLGSRLLRPNETRPASCEKEDGSKLSEFTVTNSCTPASASAPAKCEGKITRLPAKSARPTAGGS